MQGVIASRLPPEYGEVVTDLERPVSAKFGVVVPVFGRPDYLKECLASLRASDLGDAVVLLVDETDACRDLRFDGFTPIPGFDSRRGDLCLVQGSLGDAVHFARHAADCIAFNSLGWCKRSVRYAWRLTPKPHGNFRLFVKDGYLARRKDLADFARSCPPAVPDPTRDLVASLRLDAPLIRIFKRVHGNMHCSLRRGWDLLADVFGCEFLVNLDSDAIVKRDWLVRLHAAWRKIHSRTGHDGILVSGFHTACHRTLEVRGACRLKRSLGGINLFFRSTRYDPAIRSALHGIFWDHQAVRNALRDGWTLGCTAPSVVQHLGAEGVWSGGRQFDRAEDF